MYKLLSLPITVITIVTEKGLFYLLYFFVSYLYLTIRQIIWKRRLDLYDLCAEGKPEKNGFFVPEEEWKLDPPHESTFLTENSDDVFIFGTNSKLEYLTVQVSRIPNNNIRCFLLLRLSDGKIYTLPKEHSIQKATSDYHTFGSARLKLLCLIPMRKWRIFFNGTLEEHSQDSASKSYKHVRFTFLWVSSSDIFDFSTDMSKTLISHSAAASTSWPSLPTSFLRKLSSVFNRYEQPGMFQGTLQIEKEPEKELYLWGSRARSMGEISNLENSNYIDVYGSFKNGSLIHLGLLDNPALFQKFVFGYVMRCDGYIQPIEEMDYDTCGSSEDTMFIKCYAGGESYDIRIDNIETKSLKFQIEFDDISSVQMTKLIMNKKEGKGFVFKGTIKESEYLRSKYSSTEIDYSLYKDLPACTSLVVAFEKERCKLQDLCGGKGSSLGKLFALAGKTMSEDKKFSVPNGVVVTTRAYEEFVKNNLESVLRKFEEDVWSQQQDEVPLFCQKTVEIVKATKLPELVKKSIVTELKFVFEESYLDRKFAVRSSATGEDTEQMSAAGQMETFLGVKGIDEVFAAVSKCWASQFTFRAVEYRRRYGQRLNTPMAVVIQEMVPCDVAGVIFTCDPVTGNPSFITLTANWGLGESVVSASTEPDTVLLERSFENKLRYYSRTLGKKNIKIVMSDQAGTKEEELSDDLSSVYCISEIEALQLGKIALDVEDEYGSASDIEWGIANGKVFLFQSRPVTSLDIETDFEIMHIADTAMRCEVEVLSRAHVGEGMPGAASVLGGDFTRKLCDIADAKSLIGFSGEDLPEKPYSEKGLAVAFHQFFFNLISGLFKFSSGAGDFTKAMIVAMFGRLIDDKDIRPLAEERHPKKKKISVKDFLMPFYFTFYCYFAGVLTRRKARQLRDFRIPYEDKSSPSEILQVIGSNLDIIAQGMVVHADSSISSSFWNVSILSLLAKAEGAWNNVVYGDFAYLLSTCKEVESANAPAALEDLAFSISSNIKPAVFKKMDVQDALMWLQTTSCEAGQKYKQFLDRHGHRCVKEFDVFSEVWKTNPKAFVQSLQKMVSKNCKRPTEKKTDSFRVVLSKLKVKLNFLGRLRLFWYLPNARRAVGEREFSKAFLVKLMNYVREAFNHLGERMVLEGRLQKKDHLFFLFVEEIKQLCKSRSPRLVASAAKRRKFFERMDKLMFPEIISGIPKPVNETGPIATGKGFSMTGVPVSQGVIKGIARVVRNIGEASNIQPGDILITYSTDMAWSPYFPLLSGVVTELGGLISHGAVVAREYGLPCVVSLHGATRAFKSGEMVVLDGNKGIIQKVEDD